MKDQLKRKLDTDPLNDDNHEVSKKKKLKKDKQMKKQKEQNTHTAENKTQEENNSSKSENIDNKQDDMKELKKKKKKQKQICLEGNINKVMDKDTVEKENTGMTRIMESKKKKKKAESQENGTKIEQNKVTEESVESGVEQVPNVKNKDKKKKNVLEKEDSENVDQSHLNEKLKKKKEKQKKKKNKELKPDSKENHVENPEEIKEEVTEKDSQNDELIYNLLGDRPDKISTLNGFQKKLIRLSLLAANDVEKSDDQIEVVTKSKEKHKQEFRKAVDRGISKGLTVDYIDTGHSRSVKFEDSD